MDSEIRYFTLAEAQDLLPVLESLLDRVMTAKVGIQELETKLQELSRKIMFAGGMFLDINQTRRDRAVCEAHIQQAKDSLAEIEAIGVQVKDLDTGLLDFPCLLEGEAVLLCWKKGESHIGFWHTMEGGYQGRQPLDARFAKKAEEPDPDRPN
ncbi:MAG TPA: DUF2203 domain-containing protein [Silvibacterium sp.]|nr:DUF2203 domain-containing protein [Silvibacterium sp.]